MSSDNSKDSEKSLLIPTPNEAGVKPIPALIADEEYLVQNPDEDVKKTSSLNENGPPLSPAEDESDDSDYEESEDDDSDEEGEYFVEEFEKLCTSYCGRD